MRAESFLDTNVLVYAAAGRESEERKRERALALIEREDIGLSAQVLQEFYVTLFADQELHPKRVVVTHRHASGAAR